MSWCPWPECFSLAPPLCSEHAGPLFIHGLFHMHCFLDKKQHFLGAVIS